jgi:hypothetical protein
LSKITPRRTFSTPWEQHSTHFRSTPTTPLIRSITSPLDQHTSTAHVLQFRASQLFH